MAFLRQDHRAKCETISLFPLTTNNSIAADRGTTNAARIVKVRKNAKNSGSSSCNPQFPRNNTQPHQADKNSKRVRIGYRFLFLLFSRKILPVYKSKKTLTPFVFFCVVKYGMGEVE